MLKQYERYDGRKTLIVCGYFNKEESFFLRTQGYVKTWEEEIERNKHGIPVRND